MKRIDYGLNEVEMIGEDMLAICQYNDDRVKLNGAII